MLPAGGIGGASMGVASGSIVLDTRQLAQAVQTARGLAQQLDQALNRAGAGASQVASRFDTISRSIRGVTLELSALGLGGALLSRIGLGAGGAFQDATARLIGMTGGIKQATALLETLRKQAMAAGIPFADMLSVATRLLPTFQGNVRELEKWYGVIKRVASLNSQEGVSGAAFAINEALSSGGTDLVSLVDRFNISRVQLRAALQRNNGDFLAALDEVLTKMGITDEVATQLGQNFNASLRVTKDAAVQLLAEGFTPLLQTLTPLLQQSAAWLQQLRQTNPAVAQLGAGLATAAALGAPALLLLNQLIEAGQRLQQMGVLGGLGRLGVGALAAGAGAAAGVGIVNAVGAATGNQQMQQFSLSEAWLRLRQLLVNIAFTFSEVDRIIRTGLINALRTLVNAVIGAATSIGGVVSAIGGMLPGGMGGNALQRVGADLSAGGAGLQAVTNQMFDAMIANLANLTKRNRDALRGFMNFMVPEVGGSATPDAEGGGVARGPSRPDTAARDQAIREWATAAARIEREAGQARLDAQRQYEQQRTETIAQYNLAALREEEDYQRGRARAIAAYNQQVADLQADAVRRDTRWQADYNERLADLRADSNERLVELEEDYGRNRERAQRDHRDRLLSAAARLDAVAVREEQRRFAQQQQDAEANYSEQRQDIQAALDERIADELKAHQRRLQDARDADAERLADMRRAFAQQTAQEDEDRAIRLQRQADDHTRQLAQLDAAHAERLAQISRQAAEERAALNEGFIQQLSDLGIYQDAWRKLQQEQQNAALKQFEEFWRAFRKQFPDPPFNASGVPTADILRDSGGSATPVYTPTADVLRSGGARTITIGDVIVNAAPGQSATGVAREVRRELERLLEEASQ